MPEARLGRHAPALKVGIEPLLKHMPLSTYLNLDDAWGESPLGLPTLDARKWGPRLRYIARKRDIEAFWQEIGSRLGDIVIYGSGDFHHLAGALIRRVTDTPFTLISFDNHPDWDIRPPYWSCGGWAARALKTGSGSASQRNNRNRRLSMGHAEEAASPASHPALGRASEAGVEVLLQSRIEKVSVWGCGNFELQWPARMFADWRAMKSGRFAINAWAERQPVAVRKKFDCMTRENWRERFERFVGGLRGKPVYVTVDMDCLVAEEAITNWENGLFAAEDIAWAISLVRQNAKLVGGDICGAWSPPVYARFGQRFAGKWDHPKLKPSSLDNARVINLRSLTEISSAFFG